MNRSVVTYIGFTFATSWLLWGALVWMTQTNTITFGHPLFLLLYMLGGNAPAICEIWLKRKYDTTENYKAFMKSIFNVKQNLKWYAFIVITVIVNGVILTLDGNGISGDIFAKPFYFAILLMPLTLFGGGWEEIGWRGFLQFRLQEKYSRFTATMIVGIIWAIWHLPLWFMIGNPQSHMSFLNFTIVGVAISFLLTLLYSETKSIFLCIMFHTFFNSLLGVISFSDNLTASILVLVVDIAIFLGYSFFSKKSIRERKKNDSYKQEKRMIS